MPWARTDGLGRPAGRSPPPRSSPARGEEGLVGDPGEERTAGPQGGRRPLCSALGSANPQLSACATEELVVLTEPDLVDCVIRALDKENLREPIREVLRRIDTPEARAALGNQPSDV